VLPAETITAILRKQIPDCHAVVEVIESCIARRIERNTKDYSGPHVGNRQRRYFLFSKARERKGNAERPRCYTGKTLVKLWEEPDQKLVTDDVRGGGCSFWAE
jgi:hypothetical protein